MRWIGQHIVDLIARFRTTVYLENLETSTETNVLVVDSDGKVTKNADAGKQVCVTTHNFQMANTTGTVTYVPFNNLNENATGSSANYWTRTIAPYAGKVLRVGVRSDTALGTSCAIDVHKITDTTDDLNSGTVAQRVTGININTAHTTVNTDFSSAAFSAGDVVNVGLSRSAGTSAKVVVVVVWEYTL